MPALQARGSQAKRRNLGIWERLASRRKQAVSNSPRKLPTAILDSGKNITEEGLICSTHNKRPLQKDRSMNNKQHVLSGKLTYVPIYGGSSPPANNFFVPHFHFCHHHFLDMSLKSTRLRARKYWKEDTAMVCLSRQNNPISFEFKLTKIQIWTAHQSNISFVLPITKILVATVNSPKRYDSSEC